MFENFEFEFIDSGIAITSYLGNNPIISIPREICGNKVIKIGDEAFRNMEFIEEVEFEEGLLEIGNYAFCKCSSIKRLILPNSVAEIGSHAFYNCRNVEEMTLPSSLVFAGDGFIKNCGKIKPVNIASSFEISAAVVSVLNELKEEFVLHAEKEDIRLLFPAYDFDFVVNAPARLCTTYTVGSGDRYRQAITQKGIDFESYDNTFSRAVTEERENTVFHIIFEHLKTVVSVFWKSWTKTMCSPMKTLTAPLKQQRNLETASQQLLCLI